MAGAPGFEPRISGLESDGLPLAYVPRSPGACGRTRTYEVVRRLVYSQVLLLLSHTCANEFQIPNSRFQNRYLTRERIFEFRSQIHFVLKNR